MIAPIRLALWCGAALTLLAGCASATGEVGLRLVDPGFTEVDLRRQLLTGTRLVTLTKVTYELAGPAASSMPLDPRVQARSGTTVREITATSRDWVEIKGEVDGVPAPVTWRIARDGASVDARLDRPSDEKTRATLGTLQQQVVDGFQKMLVVTSQRWSVGESRSLAADAPSGDGTTRRVETTITLRGFALLGERSVAVFSIDGEAELRVGNVLVPARYASRAWIDVASGIPLLTRTEATGRLPEGSVTGRSDERLDMERSEVHVSVPAAGASRPTIPGPAGR